MAYRLEMKSQLLVYMFASWGHFVFSPIAAVFSFGISVNWKVLVVFVMQSQDKATSYGRSTEQIHSLAYQLTKTQQLINLQTYQLINLETQNSKNSKFKMLNLILQKRFNFHFVLAKQLVKR